MIKLLKGEKIMTIFLLLTILMFPLSTVFTKAILSESNIELEKLKNQINEQEGINESLSMQVDELASFDKIQEVAHPVGAAVPAFVTLSISSCEGIWSVNPLMLRRVYNASNASIFQFFMTFVFCYGHSAGMRRSHCCAPPFISLCDIACKEDGAQGMANVARKSERRVVWGNRNRVIGPFFDLFPI